MNASETCGRPTWPFEPLYKFLFAALPAWHTNTGILDVPAIASRFGVSDESVYKWLRRGKIPAARARDLFSLSQEPDNLVLISERGSETPSLLAFYEFTS